MATDAAPLTGLIPLNYLRGYSEALLLPVQQLLAERRLGASIRKRYPELHDVRSDGALVA